MKKFSNRYIFIYSTVLVAIVAVILSVVSVSLKPLQERNQRVETKQMLLRTIGVESTKDNAEDLYAQHITETQLPDGKPYFSFDGGVVIPLRGTGLWGPIWGYMALDPQGNVLGAVFDHKGETPGLGGEISTDKFAARFVGKKMDTQPIQLKKHADKEDKYQVDAISGGTMTSNGVTAMLQTAYDDYASLLGNVTVPGSGQSSNTIQQ
ncbi:MAG: FMN-binding protein [Bacteroidales bacterium]|nr:FMN-binding protein [Bacteroidales bacterium]